MFAATEAAIIPQLEVNTEPGHHYFVGKRVVVVEDSRLAEKQLCWMLNRLGLTVLGSARNGQEAIELVLQERPDIVLMDISMPVMDGIESARRIMSLYPVCLVMVTSHDSEVYAEEAESLGAVGFLVKPISLDALSEALTQAISRRPQVGPRRRLF